MVTPLPKRNLKPKFGYLFMQKKKKGKFCSKKEINVGHWKKIVQEERLIMIIGPHNIGISILKLL